ncbi:MAG: putative efflux pump outer membrane protein TtgC precursor [Syntrophorhabdus sp. PtaB.Bin047]|nr:MAG: putative efflux pump outer membrane protein TtgC precursor [Syntrophorhabdus sp. PtaB.Bin047]
MIRNAIILIAVIGCLSGCTMIPEYKRPEAPVPASWPAGPAYKGNAGGLSTVPDMDWHDFYTDGKLRQVIELSLANNRDLRVAALNIERSRAVYRVQRIVLLPLPNAAGSLNEYRTPADIGENREAATTHLYNANVGISSWEVDFFGRIRSLTQSALEQFFATEHARRSVQIALISEVANAYITYAADEENLRLAQSTLKAQESTYEMIKRRAELGSSSDLDLNQARTRVEAARADVARYTAFTAADENALNLLVGTVVAPELLSGSLDSIAPLKDISPGLSSEVLLRRPDILQAESLLKAANANIGAARAAFFPSITLTTSIGTTSNELAGLFKAGAATWSFVPQVNVPVFNSLYLWANLQAAKATREMYVAQYEKTIQSAFREVSDALARRGTIDDQLTAQTSLVDASANTYRLADARYVNGISSYLEVLDAQRSLYSAQQGLINTRLAKLSNLVNLYKVLGGGSS